MRARQHCRDEAALIEALEAVRTLTQRIHLGLPPAELKRLAVELGRAASDLRSAAHWLDLGSP